MSNLYIYLVTHKEKDKKYIGVTDNIKIIGKNTILDKLFKTEGKRAFQKEILHILNNKDLKDDFLSLYAKDLKATILEEKEDNWTHKGKNSGENSKIARKVICLNTEEVFCSGAEAGKFAGVSKCAITKACRPGHPTRIAGRNKETKEYYKWMYYDEFLAKQNGEEYIEQPSKMAPKTVKARPIICLTTGEEFDSIQDASKQYNIHASKISDACGFSIRYAGVHPETEEKLEWRFLDKEFIGQK